jgi:hypothetical protein
MTKANTKAETAIDCKPPPALAVVDWLLTGASEQQVREALQENYPSANGNEIMISVKQHLLAAGSPDPTAVKGWAVMAYRSLYQKMLAVGDYDGCRKVIKEITLLAA